MVRLAKKETKGIKKFKNYDFSSEEDNQEHDKKA